MKRFDKDVDIDEKIIELKLAMKNTNNPLVLHITNTCNLIFTKFI